MKLVLPWPPREIFPNFKNSHHWRRSHKPKTNYRDLCWGLAKQARVPPGLITQVAFHPPDRIRRDDDGMIGAFKAGRDGIALAMGVDDKLFRPQYVFGDPTPGGAVVISIAPFTPG